MTTLQYGVLAYVAFTYLAAGIWFLYLERKDNFLQYRIIASLLAPLAVPVMTLVALIVLTLDSFDVKEFK